MRQPPVQLPPGLSFDALPHHPSGPLRCPNPMAGLFLIAGGTGQSDARRGVNVLRHRVGERSGERRRGRRRVGAGVGRLAADHVSVPSAGLRDLGFRGESTDQPFQWLRRERGLRRHRRNRHQRGECRDRPRGQSADWLVQWFRRKRRVCQLCRQHRLRKLCEYGGFSWVRRFGWFGHHR